MSEPPAQLPSVPCECKHYRILKRGQTATKARGYHRVDQKNLEANLGSMESTHFGRAILTEILLCYSVLVSRHWNALASLVGTGIFRFGANHP